jgi:hypothetical protein
MNGVATAAWPLDRQDWLELAPMVRRIARIAATAPVRLIDSADGRRTAMARLPSGALVARSIGHDHPPGRGFDVTARAGDLGRWLDAEEFDTDALDTDALATDGRATDGRAEPEPTPQRDDSSWRGGRPPQAGWQRIERVPAAVVHDLVRAGARAHADAADQGMGARAAETLLDRPVLTVADGTSTAQVTNRSLSALVGMGFLPADGHIVVSTNRGWTRIAAEFGSTYVEPRRGGLALL